MPPLRRKPGSFTPANTPYDYQRLPAEPVNSNTTETPSMSVPYHPTSPIDIPLIEQPVPYPRVPINIPLIEQAVPIAPINIPLIEQYINSVIFCPTNGERVEVIDDSYLVITGYAVPTRGHAPITRVEVSIDGIGHEKWMDAELADSSPTATQSIFVDDEYVRQGWVQWTAFIPASVLQSLAHKRNHQIYPSSRPHGRLLMLDILSRATDAGRHIQMIDNPYVNTLGARYNGYGKVSGVQVLLVQRLVRREGVTLAT